MNKICHITSIHPRYDIRIYLKECITLANSGYALSLIVADGLGDELKDNINIYDIGRPTNRLARMLGTTAKIYTKVLELKPEVVHFHDPELINVGIRLAKLGYKVIYDVHEDVPKQILNKHWIPKLLRPLIAKLVGYKELQGAKSFSAIVGATQIITKRFSKVNYLIETIFNYPILDKLNQPIVKWNERKDRLVYIGSISETRGIIPLVKSLALSKVPLDLAGNFSDPALHDQLKQLEGYKYIAYHGVLKHDEALKLLQSVKIGVVTLLPTPSYVESLPIKLFEYMQMGIPVIASDFLLWCDLVKDVGYMVDPRDELAIAKATLELLNNPNSERMGKIGRDLVTNKYNWELEGQKLVSLYQKILNK